MSVGAIAVFFDIGATLASPVLSPDHTRLIALNVYPFVPAILGALRQEGVRLGIISNTAPSDTLVSLSAVLEDAGLLSFFERELLLFSSVEALDKSQVEFFERAAARATLRPTRCVFVGENEKERHVAAAASFNVSFHPLHVFQVLKELA
jgi:FMN phosphatase YigB (HAD superfamily)